MRKQTREELLKEVIELRQSNANLIADEQKIRKEFAKAFGWTKQDYYDRSKEYQDPTWSEIFIKLGKLLATQKAHDFESNLREIDARLTLLEKPNDLI